MASGARSVPPLGHPEWLLDVYLMFRSGHRREVLGNRNYAGSALARTRRWRRSSPLKDPATYAPSEQHLHPAHDA